MLTTKDAQDKAYRFIREREGGYVNHPSDRGGATNHGVTQTTYDSYRRQIGQPPQSVRSILEAEVKDIFIRNYWNVVKGDQLPPLVAIAMADFAFNSGPTRAIHEIERFLRENGYNVKMTRDGEKNVKAEKLDPETLAAVKDYVAKHGAEKLAMGVLDNRLEYVHAIVANRPSQEVFLKGWENRINDLKREIHHLAKGEFDRQPSRQTAPRQAQPQSQSLLQLGAAGESVTRLQKRLEQLGYNLGSGGIDGIFGKCTEAAVKQFQQNQGIKPVDGIVGPVTQAALAKASPARQQQSSGEVTGILQKPVSASITSHFDSNRLHPIHRVQRPHNGIDLGAPAGTPVGAADGGKVIFAKDAGNAGNTVVIDHSNEYATRYFHLSEINVQVGQQVKQGEKIGEVGLTGESTGPHLHFELRKGGVTPLRSGGVALDPEKYLGKEYQSVVNSPLQATVVANAAETLLDNLTRPAADGSRSFDGITYDIKQQGTTLSVTAVNRGEILRIEAGKIVTNKVSNEDVVRLSNVAAQIIQERQEQHSAQPQNQSYNSPKLQPAAEYARVAQAIQKNTGISTVVPYHVAAVVIDQTQDLNLARTLVQASPQAQAFGNNQPAREAFVNQTLNEAMQTVTSATRQQELAS